MIWNEKFTLGVSRFNHASTLHYAIFSPDGIWIATCCKHEGIITLWNWATGEKIGEWQGSEYEYPTFSPDSKRLLWKKRTGAIIVSIPSGEILQEVTLENSFIRCMALSPSGNLLALENSQKEAKGVYCYNLRTHNSKPFLRFSFSSQQNNAQSLHFLDEKHLQVIEGFRWDVQCSVRDLSTNRVVTQFPLPRPDSLLEYAMSPDNQLLARRANAQNVEIISLQNGELLQTLTCLPSKEDQPRYTPQVLGYAFTPDSTQLMVCRGAEIRRYRLDTGVCEEVLRCREEPCKDSMVRSGFLLRGVTFSKDNNCLLACGSNGKIYYWNAIDWTEMTPSSNSGHRSCLIEMIALDNEYILCRSSDKSLKLLSLSSGKETQWGNQNASHCLKLYFSKSQQCVFALYRTETPNSYRIISHRPDGTPLQETMLTMHLPEEVYQRAFAFSPQGTHLVSGGNDQIVRVWNIATGVCEKEITLFVPEESDAEDAIGDDCDIAILHWLANEEEIAATRMWKGHVDIVNIATSAVERRGDVSSTAAFVAQSPQRDWLLIGDTDYYELNLCKYPQGETVAFKRKTRISELITFPEGNQVAIGSEGHVFLWDTQNTSEEIALPFPYQSVQSLCITPDGRHLIAGGQNGQMVVWQRE
jgi:WD40 repeat protein